MTQTDMVLDYLNDFGSITQLEALRDLGIMRLGARVFELRDRGYDIETDMVDVKNRYGKTTRIARYRMGE